MSKTLVIIPSKGRSEKIEKHTLSWLRKSGVPFIVMVEPQEVSLYERTLTNEEMLVLPDNDRGICFSLFHGADYARKNGYDYIFKMDDDVRNWIGESRRVDDKSHLHFLMTLSDCLPALEKPGVGAIGFLYSNEMFEVKKWIRVGYRFRTCYLIKTDLYHPDPELRTYEDWIHSLDVFLANKEIVTYGKVGIDCAPVGKNKGGEQCFDRRQKSLEAIEYLKGKYPMLQWKKTTGKNWDYEPDFSNISVSTKL